MKPSEEWTGTYEPVDILRLAHDARYRALGVESRLVWYIVRALVRHWGIARIPAFVHQVAEIAGFSDGVARDSVASLVFEKWVEVEGSVVWMPRTLDFSPGMSARNPRHREAFARNVRSLGDLPIVRRYLASYPEWATAVALGGPSGAGGDSLLYSLSGTLSDSLSDSLSDRVAIAPIAIAIPIGSQEMPLDSRSRGRGPGEGTSGGATSGVSVPGVTAMPTRGTDEPAAMPTRGARDLTTPGQPNEPNDPPAVAVALATAANRAITAKYGEQMQPLKWNAPATLRLAEELAALGVPPAFAGKAITRSVQRSGNDRPPKSLGYFRDAIVEAWEAEAERQRAREVSDFDVPPGASVRQPPPGRRSAGDQTAAAIARVVGAIPKRRGGA